MNRLIWYVSYGSNLCSERFYCYIRGGRPPGAGRACPGARDNTLPRADKPVWLPGGVYFATESQIWGGGRAFYDPGASGKAAGRAYLITTEQFSDVAAQEMYREPGVDLDLTQIVTDRLIQIGTGRYETLICIGQDKQVPMVTFTAPWGIDDVPLLSPSSAYLRMLGQGLCEAHAWDAQSAADYLAGLPGAQGAWTPGEIASLLHAAGEAEDAADAADTDVAMDEAGESIPWEQIKGELDL